MENSDGPLECIDSRQQYAEIYWYHNEINGLPQAVTDINGDIVWRGTFSAWGRTEHLDHYFINRYQGAKLGQEYFPPVE